MKPSFGPAFPSWLYLRPAIGYLCLSLYNTQLLFLKLLQFLTLFLVDTVDRECKFCGRQGATNYLDLLFRPRVSLWTSDL